MSTHRLYYDNSYLQTFPARVLSCLPAQMFTSPAGTVAAWEVLLAESAFYPTSGGQPSDLGCIGEAKVLDVREEGEEIRHIVDREVEPGSFAASIDWPRRFDHMQQHTGQHLLSAMFQERFGLPTVSFHLGEGLCTIDLRGPEPTLEILQGAQRAANQIIFEDRPVTVRYGTADQLAQIGVRKEVEREGILRAIEIESADLQPCGGTHVKSTGQIGMTLVRRCRKIRQDWRVEFACGTRAERLATDDYQLLRSISGQLSCGPDEIPLAIQKLSAEYEASAKSRLGFMQHLAETRAALLLSNTPASPGGIRIIAEVLCDVLSELLLPLATELACCERTVAVLIAEESGQLVLAQHPTAGRDLQAVLKQVSAKFACKGGGTHDFLRAKLTDPKNSQKFLELAKSLVVD